MTSPARRHFEAVQAQAAAATNDLTGLSAYQRMLKHLYDDKAVLKNLSGITDKVQFKTRALEQYQEWINGIIAAQTVAADDKVTPYLMVWQIDCGLLDTAMPLAAVLIKSEAESGDEYSRTLPEIIIEQMAEQISAGADIAPENLQTLVEWATAKNADGLHELNIVDPIRAKLLKAAGEAAEEAGEPERALPLYRQALAYNDRAGVKKRIEAIEKQLDKA